MKELCINCVYHVDDVKCNRPNNYPCLIDGKLTAFVPKEDKRCFDCRYSSSGRDCPSGIDNCLANKHRDFKPREDTVTYQVKHKPEYKATGKSLTARQVIAESAIEAGEIIPLCSFLLKNSVGVEAQLFNINGFLPYALQHTCFRDFLLAGKYIEAVDAWVSPMKGDKFKIIGNEYILSSVAPSRYALINIQNGSRLDDAVDVKDYGNITKDEFYKIAGFRQGDELERI